MRNAGRRSALRRALLRATATRRCGLAARCRVFRKCRKGLPVEALPLVVVVLVVAAMVLVAVRTRQEARDTRPHTEQFVLAQPLQTRWNLTCPPPTGVKVAMPEVTPTDEEVPLADVVPCVEREAWQRSELRSGQWVLYDYVVALEQPQCWEAVTLTTHGDFTFLGSLGPLVRRWRAPVSLALYAPGDDLLATLRAIMWARACVETPLVAQHVSFHLLMDSAHVPDVVPPPPILALEDVDKEGFNCSSEEAPWIQAGAASTYRRRLGLCYPVNVARNVARETARTHFLLASDLELLPSAGLSDAFLAMVKVHGQAVSAIGRRVFALPVFEVALGVEPPVNKAQLVSQLRSGQAAPFHEHLCRECHSIPQPQRWVCAPPRTDGALGVTAVARREGVFRHWEPLYIGMHWEPLYDERLSWEGMQDKMVQSYTMCLLGYRFYILDDAFLVHQPGVKAPDSNAWRAAFSNETQKLIESTIKPELTKLYGQRSGCFL